MGISEIVQLLSGVALFLFGMTLMGDGLKKVAGSKMEMILYRLSSTSVKGVLLGSVVTAVIQSSSATSVMVVGFVNSGMMKTRQAISVILGAILGTSVTGWVICLSSIPGGGGVAELLSTATLTGIFAVTGIILRMFCKGDTKHHLGDILCGFAVLMMGMSAMSGAVSPLKELPAFTEIMTTFSNPLLGILLGCLITCVLQSASATVGILQALSMTGAIDFSVAFPVILGISVGAAVPVLISAISANVHGKRSAFSYLIINVIGCILGGGIFYGLNAFLHFGFLDAVQTPVTIAAVNSLYRLAVVCLLLPCVPLIEKLVCFLFRGNKEDEEETAEIDRLEERFVPHPALAIEQSRTALYSMARKASKNLERALTLLTDYSDAMFETVQTKEDVIDRYEDKLGTYLVKINQGELTHAQNREISKFLHTITDFERIADHAVNIAELAREINAKKLEFSPEGQRELDTLVAAIREIIAISFKAFTEEDIALAAHVEPLEQCIDDLCDAMKSNHIRRVQAGECTLGQGFVFNDLLTNYERIADHCSNIAIALIELQGDALDAHEYVIELKANQDALYQQYAAEYRERFAL